MTLEFATDECSSITASVVTFDAGYGQLPSIGADSSTSSPSSAGW